MIDHLYIYANVGLLLQFQDLEIRNVRSKGKAMMYLYTAVPASSVRTGTCHKGGTAA